MIWKKPQNYIGDGYICPSRIKGFNAKKNDMSKSYEEAVENPSDSNDEYITRNNSTIFLT